MEIVFEILFQFLGELILQLVAELLAETGVRALSRRRENRLHPVVAVLGYSLWGVIAGGLSLLVLPRSPFSDPAIRAVNLFLVPVLAGLAMMAIGGLRRRRGDDLVRIDRFGFAFVFAFAMALIRFFFAG